MELTIDQLTEIEGVLAELDNAEVYINAASATVVTKEEKRICRSYQEIKETLLKSRPKPVRLLWQRITPAANGTPSLTLIKKSGRFPVPLKITQPENLNGNYFATAKISTHSGNMLEAKDNETLQVYMIHKKGNPTLIREIKAT